jgi:LmbE family N-acetylglucosaminyl deacetylase
MKKIIFGIFAHPDDEAFGPCGTFLTESRAGSELHFITLTSGDSGVNLDNHEDLGAVRLKEWQKSGRLMGASTMTYFGYRDGKLDNTSMTEIANRLVEHVSDTLKTAPDDAEVEFIAFDLNGLTGHIDHIVASRAACLAFYTLKKQDSRLARVRLYCLSEDQQPTANTDWIYMEQGQPAARIDDVVDARALHDEIIEVMRAHHTQRQDCETTIKNRGPSLGLDHFIVMR